MEQKRGKIAAQIIEGARLNLDTLDDIKFGNATFHIKNGNVYRLEINISKLLVKENNEKGSTSY